RPPLFALGYCDVMPVDAAQLATQRTYIQGNARSRLLRLSHRDQLTTLYHCPLYSICPGIVRLPVGCSNPYQKLFGESDGAY
ncbi:MAG: hypothetical protein K5650_02230, partial [Bacteroidales bacterium]|nr:hypothetical protein [Bacteroidales bacterium]